MRVIVDRNADKEEPSVPPLTLSRSSEENDWRSIESTVNNSLRFEDLDKEKGKSFELLLKADVQKIVKRCSGQCGKLIPDDNFLVVKSQGTSHWTDKDGNASSRFGSMYIHFNRKCLEQYDSGNFLWPV